MRKGQLIVLEGGEGSGKDACAEYLKEKLKNFPEVRFTREPGGTDVGKKIREILLDKNNKDKISVLGELFLFAADRAIHCDLELRPWLAEGLSVICNRFDGSTIAYQLCGREHLEYRERFESMNAMAKGRWSGESIIKPDLVIYLDVDPQIGLARKSEQEITRFEKEDLEFHRRVRHGYREQCWGEDNWVRVNAEKSLKKVQEEVWKIVKNFLGI